MGGQSTQPSSPAERKVRTRDHIIADLSYHHVMGHVLRAGFSIDSIPADYGIDAHIETFGAGGEVENGMIFLQLKATDHIQKYRLKDGTLSFPMETKDLKYWVGEPYPAYLVLYDAVREVGYWLYIQRYLAVKSIDLSVVSTATVNLRIPADQKIDTDTPRKWQANKAKILLRVGSNVHA